MNPRFPKTSLPRLLALVGVGLGSLWAACGQWRAAAEEVWTESLLTKEGVFAIRVDEERNRIYVFRADQRALGKLRLRVRLLSQKGPARDLDLKKVERGETPERYVAYSEQWPGDLERLSFYISVDGAAWKELATFARPGQLR